MTEPTPRTDEFVDGLPGISLPPDNPALIHAVRELMVAWAEHSRKFERELLAQARELADERDMNQRFRNGFANLKDALMEAPGLPLEMAPKEDLEKWTDTITGVLMAMGILESCGRPMDMWEALLLAGVTAQEKDARALLQKGEG